MRVVTQAMNRFASRNSGGKQRMDRQNRKSKMLRIFQTQYLELLYLIPFYFSSNYATTEFQEIVVSSEKVTTVPFRGPPEQSIRT